MSDITEALLEIHYHRAIVDAFASVFGVRFLRMLKPSSQQEAWVGFDQGWVHTSLPTADLYAALSRAINVGEQEVQAFHLGYFLQFKMVQVLRRCSHLAPATFVAPYFRSELSVSSNLATGLSQHETLCRLASIESSMVYYACPLLFNVDKIYEYPDLTELQIVDVRGAPSDITNDGRHFLAFQDLANLTPSWCSEATPAKSLPCSEWVNNDGLRPRRRTAREIIELINQTSQIVSQGDAAVPIAAPRPTRLPQSFTILSFGA